MGQTGGLVSAYQLLDYSAQRVLAHNLTYTNSQEILVETISIPDVEKVRASEIIKVRVPPLYNQLAFALLSKRVPIQVYEDSSFGLTRGDLKILQEAGISYEVEGWLPRYEIHLPLKFNDGRPVPDDLFAQVRDDLIARIGGFHVLSPGSPAQGWWKSGSVVYRDDILIFRITTVQDEDQFFREYKQKLLELFEQREIWIEREETRLL